MKNEILQSHQELLANYAQTLEEKSESQLKDLEKKLLKADFSPKIVDRIYSDLNNRGGAQISYIHSIRVFLQDKLDFHYNDAIDTITEIFTPKFRENDLAYRQAVQTYLQNRSKDLVNARAEWRAYFEYRFRKQINRHLDQYFPEHWLTLNINLYSFIDNRNMPFYRLHLGVPDSHDAKYRADKDKSPYALREAAFTGLSHFQGKYSTVWEIIHNNVTSIFYFDKTPQKSLDMVVYEIDPDVRPKVSRGEPSYFGKFNAEGSHRESTILQIKPGDTNPELVFRAERAKCVNPEEKTYGECEREFQYSIMRFLIRSGIFNPLDAAFHVRLFEPKFENILQKAYSRYKSPGEHIKDNSRHEYEHMLLKELENLGNLKSLETTVLDQFNSSRRRIPYFDNSSDSWKNFDHNDKYTQEENEQLDLVIKLLDLEDPLSLDVRMSIFEAGFFYITQEDNTISHIYWLPVIINWKEQLTGGATFINSDKRIDPDLEWSKDPETGKYVEGSNAPTMPLTPSHSVPQDLISLLYFFNGLFVDKQIGEIEEVVRAPQERSAAVSVMSRNISHNLGSHVLSYLKNTLSNEEQMVDANILAGLPEELLSLIRNGDIVLPTLRSIGTLLDYFQERQDYIGTFASDRYLYFSPVYFRSSILKHFYTPVDPAKEHPFRNLILDYIVYSEGYTSKDIVINTQWKDAETGEVTPLDDNNDFEVALPSGNTGRQGIYTILENFIRNSAKHGIPKDKRPNQRMEVSIVISEAPEPADKSGIRYYKVEVQDNSSNIDRAKLERISKALNDPLMQKDGNPHEQHKGIKEIQIATGWLRGIQPHQLNEAAPGELPVLQIPEKPKDDEGIALKYVFYLRRPTPGLLIVKDKSKYYGAEKTGELMPAYQENLKDWRIEEYYPDIELNPKKVQYQFVAIEKALEIDTKDWKKQYFHILSQCPVRVVTGIDDGFLLAADFKKRLVQKWLNEHAPFDDMQKHSRFAITLPFAANPRRLSEDKDFRIGISDPNPSRAFSEEPDIREYVIDNTDEGEKQPIVFRRHNDLSAQFDHFRKDDSELKDYLFVEGISGDNTNNRLFRFETISHLWRYKMLEAALTKIIIIDERIWNNYYKPGRTKENDRNYQLWAKKNIHILSLEQDMEHPGYLFMKDLRGENVVRLDENGEVEFVNRGRNQPIYEQSHFISLHQGLLERGIKFCSNSALLKNKDEQDQIDSLLKRFKDEVFKVKFRVTIHSGRSKTHILPKRTAFVQLASLGSALRDCKLSLCELFYATIQEENK